MSMTLLGLRSRCVIPTSCAAVSAEASCEMMRSVAGSESVPRFLVRRWLSVEPARYSITR